MIKDCSRHFLIMLSGKKKKEEQEQEQEQEEERDRCSMKKP
jgi:hypothetical protein